MMAYRTVKDALVTLLGDNAAGQFTVMGYQGQSVNAKEITENNKRVVVYYSGGEFPKTSGRVGPYEHNITLNIDMKCSASASGDISALLSETSTAAERAAALYGIDTAAQKADELIDELIDAVFNIIMDARNDTFGLDVGDYSNRWIDRIQKDTTLEHGDLVVKTASMPVMMRVQEIATGDIGNEPDNVLFDSELTINGSVGAGVLTENDNT